MQCVVILFAPFLLQLVLHESPAEPTLVFHDSTKTISSLGNSFGIVLSTVAPNCCGDSMSSTRGAQSKGPSPKYGVNGRGEEEWHGEHAGNDYRGGGPVDHGLVGEW